MALLLSRLYCLVRKKPNFGQEYRIKIMKCQIRKKGQPFTNEGLPFFSLNCGLNYFNVYSVSALWSLFNFKGNLVTFVKRPETRRIDSGVMDENIRAIFLLDEAITLTVIKPFYNTICHCDTPFVL
jgi:hypothetical protein